jgi:hypothetical protein
MNRPPIPAGLQAWIDARRRLRLSDAHIQMARELGMNPRKLENKADHQQEAWKLPLPDFIETLYARRFGRRRPEHIISIEARAEALARKKAVQQQRRNERRAEDRVERRAWSEMDVRGEAASIVVGAAARLARIVSIGPLLFFSTEAGDAWVLDPAEMLSRCLARDGVPLPGGIVETPESFGVEWQFNYTLEADVLTVADHAGRLVVIPGPIASEIRRVVTLMHDNAR